MSPRILEDLWSLDQDALRRIAAGSGEASEACTPRCSQFALGSPSAVRYPENLAYETTPRLSNFVPTTYGLSSRPSSAESSLFQFVPVEHARNKSHSLEPTPRLTHMVPESFRGDVEVGTPRL